MPAISLAALLTLIFLCDSYLRYLSFKNYMTAVEKDILARRFLLYGVTCAIFCAAVFEKFGITSALYKFFLMTGWLPWLAIFMLTVKRNMLNHVFIFGLSTVWSTIQHNWSAMIVVLFFSEPEQLVVLTHAALYPLLFLIFLPLERNFFSKLMPHENFFDDYGKFIAFLPLIAISGTLLLWIQEPVVHSWAERFSRIYIPFIFLFFYRYVLNSAKKADDTRLLNRNLRRMQEQLTVLKEYNRLMQDSREKISVMRHDLRHSYRLIAVMLDKNEISAAKDYVGRQETLLGKTKVKNFCKPPLLNAALSFYISRAESSGIKVRHKINLPEKISTDESDFALLMSNLLENAVNACSKQKFGEKFISVTIQQIGGQCVLEVVNSCDSAVHFDEKNYPRTSKEGHGLGIASIKLFGEKYDAYTDFLLEGGLFKVTMYWRI